MNTVWNPLFAGQTLFGDLVNFEWNPLVGGPASVDEFLGNAPGTTVGPPQRMVAASGSFTAPTSDAVQAALDLLASFSGPSYPLGLPTGRRFPVDFIWTARWCYFLADEFRPGSIAPAAGNQYSATYLIVFRETSP